MKVEIVKAVQELQAECYGNAFAAGWYHDLHTGELLAMNDGERCMLICSEAFEGLRKNLMDDKLPHRPMAEAEMADAVIRIMDFCGHKGYDLAGAIAEKIEYNKNREDHKIENRKGVNGKKF